MLIHLTIIPDTDGAQIVLFVFENQPGGPPRQVLEAQKHFPVVCLKATHRTHFHLFFFFPALLQSTLIRTLLQL
jgi:hypothetical protein